MLQAGKLSVHVEGIPLRQVLAEVSRLNRTPIVWLSGEGQEEPVSLEFTDLPLLEGLERILRRQNFVLFYESQPTGAQLRQIWVASKRKVTEPPTPLEEATKTPPAPGEQAAAVEQQGAATSLRNRAMQSILQRAVSHSDPRMRVNAVIYLGAHMQDDPQARATLEEIARSDTNVQVRQAAAEALQRKE
jgi:hypothetical protein